MVDEQREDLLQRGFEAGMDAGLREGRGAGYWIGAAAAVEGLPPALAAALQRGERSASALTAVLPVKIAALYWLRTSVAASVPRISSIPAIATDGTV